MPNINARVPHSLRERGYLSGSSTGLSVKLRLNEILDSDFGLPAKDSPALISAYIDEQSSTAVIWVSEDQKNKLAVLAQRNHLQAEPQAQLLRYLLTAHAASLQAAEPQVIQVEEKSAPLIDTFQAMPSPMKPHDEQLRLYDEMDRFVDAPEGEHQVLFAEAGTGIGKTLTYLTLAIEHIHKLRQKGGSPLICIAVPTYNNVTELMQSWESCLAQQVDFRPATLAAKRDFVSQQALKELLQNVFDETDPIALEVRDWLANPVPERGFRNQASWTMQGLIAAAPGFLFHDLVRLDDRTDDDDLGYLAYQAQWREATKSPLWIMTHAMLASLTKQRLIAHRSSVRSSPDELAKVNQAVEDWRSRRSQLSLYLEPKQDDDALIYRAQVTLDDNERAGLLHRVLNDIYQDSNLDDSLFMSKLPDFDLTIVDEAHMLDASFDLVLSNRVSLWSLLQDLRRIRSTGLRGPVTKQMVDNMDSLLKKLQSSPGGIEAIDLTSSTGKSIIQSMHECCSGVSRIKLKDDYKSSVAEIRRVSAVERSLKLMLRLLDSGQGFSGYVDWSPDRKWPRLVMGRTNLGAELDYLWSVVSSRSILVSGTLYEHMPTPSIEHVRRNLTVRPDKAVIMTPIHAYWQFSCTRILLVNESRRPDGSLSFSRPGSSESKTLDEESFAKRRNAWVDDVAHYIWRAHGAGVKGQGGMLVLCTAFADIKDIGERLLAYMDSLNSKHPVLMHQPDMPLAALKRDYREHLLNGVRPILLGSGSAWTGFDLHWADIPAAVTDLVLVNAPFGAVSKLVSHQKRGYLSAVYDMFVLVRQGIGRLVRNKLKEGEVRRVHWIDARIHIPENASWTRPIRQFFSKYPEVRV